jgi:RHS repeat-associated protein
MLARIEFTASVIEALGVAGEERTAQTLDYGANGQLLSFTDAKGNKTAYTYDGFDRAKTLIYPSKTTPGQVEGADYVETYYLANGDVEKQRLRDGQMVSVQYDDLGRLKLQDVPDADRDLTPSYDNLGRVTALTLPGSNAARSVSTVYDIFGRPTSITSAGRTITYEYDPGFLWSRLVYPDGLKIQYDSDILGRITRIAEVTASGALVQLLATYAYDDLGRRTSVTYGNGSSTAYSYTPVSQLASLTQNLAGTANDVAFTFQYNAAGQIAAQDRSNDGYVWQNHFNVTRGYTANGQNQYTAVGTAQPSYDGRGNLKSDGLYQFSYDTAGNFTAAAGPNSMALSYDALGRLAQTASSASTTNFLYDGTAMIGEYDGAGTLLRRTIHGPGTDEPIVVYESGTRKWLHADPRGSIIAQSDASGTATATNSYGPYGEEGLAMSGRFGYTGQMRLPELGLMHYKARAYSPKYGRFLQPDPIGTEGGLNIYEYAGSDPVNASDPSGLAWRRDYRRCTSSEAANAQAGLPSGQILGGCSVPFNYWVADDPFSTTGGYADEADREREFAVVQSHCKSTPVYRWGAFHCQDEEAEAETVVTATESLPNNIVLIATNDSEHTKNARPSTLEKHEKGQNRKSIDRGGEKGDKSRRFPRNPPDNWKGGPWPPVKRIDPFMFVPDYLMRPCAFPVGAEQQIQCNGVV